VAAYEPSGVGAFSFLFVEKRNMTTAELVDQLGEALGIRSGEIGAAGYKDKRAITRQWISVPGVVEEIAGLGPIGERDSGFSILESKLHDKKLRTGHLRGNRFKIWVRGLGASCADAVSGRAAEIRQRGFANSYGPQRFGRGETARIGLKALKGQRHRNRRLVRLGISAVQSALFNHWLLQRVDDGLMVTAVEGDVLKKTETGGLFVCDDPLRDTERLVAGEVSVAGPIFGYKMFRASGPASAREQRVLDAFEMSREDFRTVGKLGIGTRRASRVVPKDLEVVFEGDDVLVTVTLPRGCYATVLLGLLISRELVHGQP
jgi:tRNA pseudouridine13 synthase